MYAVCICIYWTSSGIPNSLWREFAGYVCVETAGLAANSGPVKVIARMSLPPLCGQPTVVNKLRWGHSLRSRSSKSHVSFHQVSMKFAQLCSLHLGRCALSQKGVFEPPALISPFRLRKLFNIFFDDRMALYFWFVFGLLILVESPIEKWPSKPSCEKTCCIFALKTSHVFPLEDLRLMKSGRDNEKKRPEIRVCVVWVGKIATFGDVVKENPPKMSINSGFQMSECCFFDKGHQGLPT